MSGVVPSSEFRVLYEDNHCLAVLKQAGQLIAADSTGDITLSDLAKSYIAEKYSKPGAVYLGVVHRLDRPVSGVVLFARTSKAAARLAQQFREGTVTKTYLAWVNGSPELDSQRLEDWLQRSTNRNVTRVVAEGVDSAKHSSLTYTVRRRIAGRTLLAIELHTGRHHQIRVQLSSRGWPILGDLKYGGPRCHNPRAIALHAAALAFDHPTAKERIQLEAEIPQIWTDWFGTPEG
ncbi:MAG: RluA family pseudouridine synthase [Planctomycetota bacterium]